MDGSIGEKKVVPAIAALDPNRVVANGYEFYKLVVEKEAANAAKEARRAQRLKDEEAQRSWWFRFRRWIAAGKNGFHVGPEVHELAARASMIDGPDPNDEAIKRTERVCNNFEALYGLCSVGDENWIYLTAAYEAADGYKWALIAQKRDVIEQVEEAREAKFEEITRSVFTATAWGMIRATGTLLGASFIVGAVTFFATEFITRSVFEVKMWLSVFTTAITVIWYGAYLLGKTGKSLQEIEAAFNSQKKKIRDAQKKEHKKGFDIAWESAARAYERLTGQRMAEDDVIKKRLEDVMNGDIEEMAAPSETSTGFRALVRLAIVTSRFMARRNRARRIAMSSGAAKQ